VSFGHLEAIHICDATVMRGAIRVDYLYLIRIRMYDGDGTIGRDRPSSAHGEWIQVREPNGRVRRRGIFREREMGYGIQTRGGGIPPDDGLDISHTSGPVQPPLPVASLGPGKGRDQIDDSSCSPLRRQDQQTVIGIVEDGAAIADEGQETRWEQVLSGARSASSDLGRLCQLGIK
jgi:hypothetical protein